MVYLDQIARRHPHPKKKENNTMKTVYMNWRKHKSRSTW